MYFTCHPADFDLYFHLICDDIFQSQNCAIYYTEDMTAPYDGDRELEMSAMNLFVFPVSHRFLSESGRARDEDLPYALKNHIPILPIAVDPEIDADYEKVFDKIEYLDRVTVDLTAISYEEKLKKYLGALLLSDEMAERIRAAFDAYVFMSYRKKDRKYANELMKIIHDDPMCRDIAIWYDEFLLPGENFEDSIRKAMETSDLFTMVVTPSLTEEGNYVQKTEYPEATRMGKKILPVKMQDTDESLLKEMYVRIPDSIRGQREKRFYDTIISMIADKGRTEKKDDPEHNFLMGLAYLDGIDVEKNPERALELIESAAEAGLPEASEMLGQIYSFGICVEMDRDKWRECMEKACQNAEQRYGHSDPRVWKLKEDLVNCYASTLRYQEELALQEEIYKWYLEQYGIDHAATLHTLSGLIRSCNHMGNYARAIELGEYGIGHMISVFGEDDGITTSARTFLTYSYVGMGQFDKAIEAGEVLLKQLERIYGADSLQVSFVLTSIGHAYMNKGNFPEACKRLDTACEIQKKILPEDSAAFQMTLIYLAACYLQMGDYAASIELNRELYGLQEKRYGENYPGLIAIGSNLGVAALRMGDYSKAIAYLEPASQKASAVFGEKHPDALAIKGNLLSAYTETGEYEQAMAMADGLCDGMSAALGEEHPRTLEMCRRRSYLYTKMGIDEKGSGKN